MIRSSKLSILVKIIGCAIIVVALILKCLDLITVQMSEVILGAGGLELMVLPIDISKIKTAVRSEK